MMTLRLEIVPGDTAPKYSEGTELTCDKVVITEKGTASDLPIVDFVMRDHEGKMYLLVLTGRVVNSISAAIKGVNSRNHGTPEP